MLITSSVPFAASLVLLVSCLMALAAGADTPPSPMDPPTDLERREVVAGNNALAFELFSQIATREHGNLCFSPFGVRSALAMSYAGARGATGAQMRQTLHFGQDDRRLHQVMGAVIAGRRSGDPGCELTVANGLWVDRSLPIQRPFLELVQVSYGAGFQSADFIGGADRARDDINGWVADRTKQRITGLIPPGAVTSATRLVLANAIHFKGAWQQPFDPALTVREVWAGGAEQASFMHRRGIYHHAQLLMVENPSQDSGRENGLVQVLELPYVGGALSMLVLLPSHNTHLPDLEREMTAPKLAMAVDALQPQEVALALPRFSLAWGASDLGPRGLSALPGLGMRDAFLPMEADFSGIDGTRGLHIDSVFHKTVIDVAEHGTEAAAATSVAVAPASVPGDAPVAFRADRPFLFLIRDRIDGTVLFLGRVVKP